MIRLAVHPVELPLAAPLATAAGTIRSRSVWLVSASEGRCTGWGEACPLPGFGGEAPAACVAALGQLAGRDLTGTDPRRGLGLYESVVAQSPCARSAILGALADLAARRAGVPLARCYATSAVATVPVNALASDPADAARLLAAGWRCIKLKSSGGPQADLDRLAELRRRFPQARLRLDANGRWQPNHVLPLAAALGQVVEYVEQPFAPGLLAPCAVVRAAGLRVALDEGVRGEADLAAAIAVGACDAVVLKPAWLGGWDRLSAIANQARQAGVQVVLSSALGSGVERLHALHLACALGLASTAHGLDTGRFVGRDVVRLPPASPMLTLPRGDGLGADVRL